MEFIVGTNGCSYLDWKDGFYPPRLKTAEMLGLYAKQFKALEVSGTSRRMPTPPVLAKWKRETPAGFQFALQAPERFTHASELRPGKLLEEFIEAAGALGPRLGPVLLRMSPTMTKDAGRLREFLAVLPSWMQMAFEFGHESWFDEEVYGILGRARATMCVTEGAEAPPAPLRATAYWGYLRLRRGGYSDAELAEWVRKARGLPWDPVYVFFKYEYGPRGPDAALRFAALTAKVDGKKEDTEARMRKEVGNKALRGIEAPKRGARRRAR